MILLFINIFFYIFTLLIFFCLVFMLNSLFLKTLTDLKFLSVNTLFLKIVVFLFLFLAGMPPFLTFFSKFFLFTSILTYGSLIILIGFFFLNGFSIYFYIQQLRVIIYQRKINKQASNLLQFKLNFSLCYLLIILFFFIFFGFFFFLI